MVRSAAEYSLKGEGANGLCGTLALLIKLRVGAPKSRYFIFPVLGEAVPSW